MATNGKANGRRRHNIGRVALAVVHKFGYPEVTKVVDATEDLEVEVTERDAKNSRKKDHADCAMAVATRRQEGAKTTKKVGSIISRSIAYVIRGNTATRYEVPPSVRSEVISFDRGGGFEVGNYQLKAVQPATRLGAQSQRSSNADHHNSSGAAMARFIHRTVNVRDDLKRKVITAGE